MPIDIALIRAPNEGGVPDEVHKWQVVRISKDIIRHGHHHLEEENHSTIDVGCQIEEFILTLSRMDVNKRSLLKKQSWMKTRMNRLKAALGPKPMNTILDDGTENSKVDKNEIQSEIQNLKMMLPSVTKEYDDIVSWLNNNILCLANIVDDAEFHSTHLEKLNDSRGVQMQNEEDWNASFSDPLFCIGGYENIMVPVPSSSSSSKWNATNEKGKMMDVQDEIQLQLKSIMTGPGSDIYHSLFLYGKRYFSTHNLLADNVKTIHLPANIAMSSSIAHGTFGCVGGTNRHCQRSNQVPSTCSQSQTQCCRICNQENVRVPSYLAITLMNQNKIFSEKTLPCTYFIQTCGGSDDKISFEFIHEPASLELLCFTVNNLHISRQCQNDMAQMILDFYSSLLCSKIELQRSVSLVATSKEQPLRVRTLSPCEMDMNECRRVVVEGYIPSKKRYVELARVSNYTDYISRQFKLKCVGPNAQSTDYVHMVHCTLLQDTVIHWVVENNLSQYHGTLSHDSKSNKTSLVKGIVIPSVLTPFITKRKTCSDDCVTFLPFTREITKGKGGKVNIIPSKQMIEEIPVETLRTPGSQGNDKMEKSRKLQFHTGVISNALPNPTDEAICNPYDFLPMFRM